MWSTKKILITGQLHTKGNYLERFGNGAQLKPGKHFE